MCTPGSSMQHGSFGPNYMPSFDQMGGTAPVDTENLSLEHRTQVTGRELQELLSVSHQSIDEAQERLVLLLMRTKSPYHLYVILI